MTNNIDKDNFTLVLSGGGALGIAHLGVLHDMEKQNIVPKEVIGTSMGAIIAASLAIGMREEEIYKKIKDFTAITKWMTFSFSGNSVVDNKKIEKILKNIFNDKKMKDVSIPLKIISTNLLNGQKKVFDANSDVYIYDAVLSSMAIPGLFKEHKIDNQIYGDGFLCENLGITEAKHNDILAVDVLGENSFQRELPDNFLKTSNVLEMFEKSMRLLIFNQTKTNLKYLRKNIHLIEPDTKDFKTYQFNKHKELRELGLGLL
ncbi:SERINE PROTEASE [hydrothermal vent metagenome]|uniref:SERINE PROTEASE n=1 Tax=hydrothermal vent metagenome TaxID=652676 RepID=A0A1W1EDC5_9ZZZZ